MTTHAKGWGVTSPTDAIHALDFERRDLPHAADRLATRIEREYRA